MKEKFLTVNLMEKEKYNNNGILEYEGEYLNGESNGKGKLYYNNDKLNFEGEFLNGEKNGQGKEYNMEGKIIYEGKYLNGNILKD